MIKKLLAAMLALFAAVAFAAVDVNKATQAELESIKGIGPAISSKILEERKKGSFKDWQDMIDRVKGVGEGNAAKFSGEGLSVNGAACGGAPAKAAAPAPAVKKDAPPAASPAPAAKAETKAAPMSAEDKKAAAKKEKEEKKVAKAAAAEQAKKTKADKAAAAAAPASAVAKK